MPDTINTNEKALAKVDILYKSWVPQKNKMPRKLSLPGERELERGDDVDLHLEDLPVSVGLVGDVDKVAQLGRVHLLVLGGDEEAGDAHQLHVAGAQVGQALLKKTTKQRVCRTNRQ